MTTEQVQPTRKSTDFLLARIHEIDVHMLELVYSIYRARAAKTKEKEKSRRA